VTGRASLVGLGALVLAGLVVSLGTFFTVYETQQALVLQFGAPKRVIQNPGLHVKIPFVQNVVYVDRRILALDTQPEEVIASDQKRLVVDAFARFRITDPILFYQALGSEQAARSRLGTVLNSSLRQVLGSQNFVAVLSGERATLMRQIRDRMNAEARAFGIEVVDVRIRRADLPEANSQAIYRRMQTAREREAREARAQGAEIAQRIRSRADRESTVLVAEARRDAEITRGEGDAERNRIYAEAYRQDPEFFRFVRSLQAYEKALKDRDTTFVLSPGSEFFQFFQSHGEPSQAQDGSGPGPAGIPGAPAPQRPGAPNGAGTPGPSGAPGPSQPSGGPGKQP
jgi:membrane protease subunit HflC